MCRNTVADIAFVLDDSGSVKKRNFFRMKRFIIGIVRSLRIGWKNVRVAVVSFSTKAVVNFHLNRHHNKRSLIRAIHRIRYRRGGTNTHYALRKLRRSVFRRRHGDRRRVPNIAIVLTDGKSSNGRAVRKEAYKLKRSGVLIISIGVGKNIRHSELRDMASQPTSLFKFTVKNFSALKYVVKKITKRTCKGMCMFINENCY